MTPPPPTATATAGDYAAIRRFPPREEFAESLEHPDPVSLVLLPPRDAYPAMPADSSVGSGRALHEGGRNPVRPGGELRGIKKKSSPTPSAQSTGRVDEKVAAGQCTTRQNSLHLENECINSPRSL